METGEEEAGENNKLSVAGRHRHGCQANAAGIVGAGPPEEAAYGLNALLRPHPRRGELSLSTAPLGGLPGLLLLGRHGCLRERESKGARRLWETKEAQGQEQEGEGDVKS